MTEQTRQAFLGLKASLVSWADVVLDNHLALDYLLTEQGGVCAITNASCCTWINATGQVDVNIKEIYTQAEGLHNVGKGNITSTVWSIVREALAKLNWFLPFLGPLMATVVLLLLCPCLFNLLVQFVSSRLQQFQVRLMMAQGIQPIAAEGGPGPYRSLEQPARDFYATRVRLGSATPVQEEEVSEEENSGPLTLKNKGYRILQGGMRQAGT